jgi:hypothetical protein
MYSDFNILTSSYYLTQLISINVFINYFKIVALLQLLDSKSCWNSWKLAVPLLCSSTTLINSLTATLSNRTESHLVFISGTMWLLFLSVCFAYTDGPFSVIGMLFLFVSCGLLFQVRSAILNTIVFSVSDCWILRILIPTGIYSYNEQSVSPG